MKGLQLHGEDLHARERNEEIPTVFDAMVDDRDEEQVMGTDHEDRGIWLERQQDDDLLDVNDASLFYGDLPPLPDFPCISSSSSSSSTPAPVKSIAGSSSSSSASSSSSSSAASWALLRSDAEEDHHHHHHQNHNHNHDRQGQYGQNDPVDTAPATALSSTGSMEIFQQSDHHQGMDGVDCMDVMETFGYMDLLDSNDFFDPSSIFHQDETPPLEDFHHQQNLEDQKRQQQPQVDEETDHDHQEIHGAEGAGAADNLPDDDLAMVFLEWLKSNKETVSAEDLRRVKIKKSTIECAARRLGGGKEAMKQLLKLILEWVQTNHLQKRRLKESSLPSNNTNTTTNNTNLPYQQQQYQDPFQNPNPNSNNLNCNPIQPELLPNPCFSHSPWIPNPSYDPAVVVPGFGHPVVGYMGDPFGNGASYGNPSPHHVEYHMLDSAQTWSPSHQFAALSNTQYNSFPDNSLHQSGPVFTGYGSTQYPYTTHQYLHGDQRLVSLGSSATKEARKKRMARQRRLLSHHRNHHNSNQQQNHQSGGDQQQARLDNCSPSMGPPQVSPNNWVYWPTVAGGGPGSNQQPVLPGRDHAPVVHQVVDRPAAVAAAMQGQQSYQRQVASDRRQGWKPEKNLRFLLQKVLKQSDVGNLGRIVLPKKEAETHLPELEARDGISIAMEDIGTSRVWNMRYRFWPNNKSRMYLLENTGDFVKANGLQEGDFIVIYSDVKCGKYLIRGVKVRQPGPKSENKRAGKSQRQLNSNSPSTHAAAAAADGSSSSPIITQTVK